MQGEKENGSNAQQLQIPEGDRYLLVRISKAGEFAVVFSSMTDALALLKTGNVFLEEQIKKDLFPQHTGISIGQLDANVLANLKRRGIKVPS